MYMPAEGNRAVELLLVEDDPHAASLFLERVSHFAPGEFKVTQARSLRAGLEEAADISYGVAVLDLTLPDSTGIETCSTFSAAQPDVPFIVLTGVDDGSLVETLSRAGARAAFVKEDCQAQDLVNAIRSASVAPQQPAPGASTAVSEARFRNAIIDSADGIVVIGASGEILLVSAGAESLLGRPAADLTGSPLGIDLHVGQPVRAQVLREQPGHADSHADSGPVRQFDVCQLQINEVEFWPFSHQWSGNPVTVCAMRDVTNQSAEENRQHSVARIEQPLQVSAGIEAVCADIAVRLGALVRFNRFEAAVWRPDLERLQIMAELGMNANGRTVSVLIPRGSVPDEFGSWTTEWSSENRSPRVAVSVGYVEPDAHSSRDEAVVARCASMIASELNNMKKLPVLTPASQELPGSVGDSDHWPGTDTALPEAA